MPSLCRTSRFRRSPASFRSPSLIMSSTPFTEVGCIDLRVTFLLILCSCVQVITGLTRRHRKWNKSPDGNAPFLHHRSSIAFQHPSPLPLPQLAPQNQSPTRQNHPSWRQHQGTCTEMARWGWVFVRMITLKCSYLAQMQHSGCMDQACRGEKPFMLSEIYQVLVTWSHMSESYKTESPTWCCKWTDIQDALQIWNWVKRRFSPQISQLFHSAAVKQSFPLSASEAGSFPRKRLWLFMTLWLCSCPRATQSHNAIEAWNADTVIIIITRCWKLTPAWLSAVYQHSYWLGI